MVSEHNDLGIKSNTIAGSWVIWDSKVGRMAADCEYNSTIAWTQLDNILIPNICRSMTRNFHSPMQHGHSTKCPLPTDIIVVIVTEICQDLIHDGSSQIHTTSITNECLKPVVHQNSLLAYVESRRFQSYIFMTLTAGAFLSKFVKKYPH